MLMVANGMFGRNWKMFDANKERFDKDTLPEKIRTLEKMRQIEAQSLSLVAAEVHKDKEEGHMITHASDSTTRRGVGKFICQGLHISQGCACPLHLLGISGETKEEIASQRQKSGI